MIDKTEIEQVAIDINAYPETVKIFFELSRDLNTGRTASTSINFRDSLCHYSKLFEAFESNEERKFIEQYACLYEHLWRGIKDSLIYFLYSISKKIFFLLNRDLFLKEKKQKRLRKFLHIFKKIILQVRLDSLDLKRIDKQNENMRNIIVNIAELKKFLKDNDLYSLFISRLHYNMYG